MQALAGSSPAVVGAEKFSPMTPAQAGGRRRRGASVKTLKKILKKAGLKTSGKKAALTRRAKKAHLKVGGGGEVEEGEMENPITALPKSPEGAEGGRRRRRNGLVRGVYRGVTGVAKGTLRSVGRVGKAVFGRGKGTKRA